MPPFTHQRTRGRCDFLDRVPPEVRVRIYRHPLNVSNADNSPKRRIYFRRGPSVNHADIHSATPGDTEQRARRKWVETAILTICKTVYFEAIHELIANNIVVVEIEDLNDFFTYDIVRSMRHVEVRDTANAPGGRQTFVPPEDRNMSWTDEEKRCLESVAALQLKNIGRLLVQAPSLKSLVIGFEVLRLYHDRHRNASICPSQMTTAIARANASLLIPDHSPFTCMSYGKWLAQTALGVSVSIQHFNLISLMEKASATACACGGSSVKRRRDFREAYERGGDDEANIVWSRHLLAILGWLGREAQRRCNGDGGWDEVSLNDDWMTRTAVMIGVNWMGVRSTI